MKRVFCIFLLLFTLSFTQQGKAQCSMCTVNAEQSVKNGNSQGKGLNNGILYLLAIPYLLITGIGVLWYVKYQRKTKSPAIDLPRS